MGDPFYKACLLFLVLAFFSFSQAFADPQPITETTFNYQSNGDPVSQTLNWAYNRPHIQLNNIQQQTRQIFYVKATANNLCHKELPVALKVSSITSDLICLSQTHYLQTASTTASSQGTPITSLSYIDSRTGEVRARVDAMGHAVLYHYDQLGRQTAIIYQPGQADQSKTTISYLSAGKPDNTTGYNQVIVTKPNGVEERTLVGGLGQVVEKQVNTYPDEKPGTADVNYAAYNPGALMPSGQFRTLSRASYIDSQGVVQPQVQSSTDALGAITEYQYDALGRRQATTIQITVPADRAKPPSITNARLINVTHGVIYDPVDRLQVSYQQVAGSVSTDDPHTVQVQYFNPSGKVSQTQQIPLYQSGQGYTLWRKSHSSEPVCTASTLFTGDACRSALVEYLASKPAIGQSQSTHYNSLLQKQQQRNSLQQTDYQYNDRGLADRVSIQGLTATTQQPAGSSYHNQLQYNLLGKLVSSTFSQGSAPDIKHISDTHDYNSLGELSRLSSYTAENTRQRPLLSSDFSYNADGQLIRRSNSYAADNTHITYCRSYNNQGQTLASWDVKQADANCSQPEATAQDYKVWAYYQPGNNQGQPAGKLESIADAGNTDPVTYSYYPDGALKQVNYADGLTIDYQYNVAGQLTYVSYFQHGALQSQSKYQYGTGTAHQLLQVTSGTTQVSYQYNDLGNPTLITRTSPSLSVTTQKTYSHYDLVKASATCLGDSCQIDSLQAQQQVNYTYSQGQLTQVRIKHPQLDLKVTDKDYNQFNYIKKYTYDSLDRLAQLDTSSLADSPLKTVHYQFDLNNNITRVTTTDYAKSQQKQLGQHYNGADQLISQTTNNESAKHFSYTAGNLTNGPNGSEYKYNNLNQLIQYTSPEGEVTDYQYYPDGTLQNESQGPTNKLTFYYSGGQIALVKDNQGNWASYLGGLTREAVIYHHAGGKNRVEFYAYQGKTPSGWLGQSGSTWQQRDPYGLSEAVYTPTTGSHSNPSATPANPLSLADNPHLMGFNGNYQDLVSDIVFMAARVYDPSLQRFLQLDSVDVPNRYAFAQSNPIEKYDPSGHSFSFKSMWKRITAIVGYYGIFMALFALTDPLIDGIVSVGWTIAASVGRGLLVGAGAMAARDGLEKAAFGAKISGKEIGMDALAGGLSEATCGLVSSGLDGAIGSAVKVVDAAEEGTPATGFNKLFSALRPRFTEQVEGADASVIGPYKVGRTVAMACKDALEPVWYFAASQIPGAQHMSLRSLGTNACIYFFTSLVSRGVIRDDSFMAESKEIRFTADGTPSGKLLGIVPNRIETISSPAALGVRRFVERGIRYWVFRAPARGAVFARFNDDPDDPYYG